MVVDTSILIANERGQFALERFLTSQETEQFHIAAITVAELYHGVERATPQSRKEVREQYVRRWLGRMQVLPYGTDIALRHAMIWAELMSVGASAADAGIEWTSSACSQDDWV